MFEKIFLSAAYAQSSGGPPSANGFLGIFPIILVFGVIYFLLLRPSFKEQKKRDALQKELKKGDQVLTSGGLIGIIHSVDEKIVVLKSEDGSKWKLTRSSVTSRLQSLSDAKKK